tara:strand:+ start:2971 stop:4566 length:1596 start_codon:yes stop_codon:yes gene_type:complete
MTDIAGSYITIQSSNIQNDKTKVRQLIDVVQSDIASTSSGGTRKSYEVFVSGVNEQNITSSLFQTVFDQDFTLGSANPLFDLTIGSLLEEDENGEPFVNEITSISKGDGGKLINFSNSTPMMREKINIYKQFAQNLLGNSNSSFFVPHSATVEQQLTQENALTRHKKIRGAIFICFRRLFTRDNMQKGTLSIKINRKAKSLFSEFLSENDRTTGSNVTNIAADPEAGQAAMDVLDDSILNISVTSEGGEVSTIKNSAGQHVGSIFYDSGIIVLDVERVFESDQTITGFIDSVRTASDGTSINQKFLVYGRKTGQNAGEDLERYYYPVYTAQNNDSSFLSLTDFVPVNTAGDSDGTPVTLFYDGANFASTINGVAQRPDTTRLPFYNNIQTPGTYYSALVNDEAAGLTLHNGSLYPSLWTSGTIDDVLDHICFTRFGQNETASSMTFRNETFINSTFIFCRAAPSQMNYSTNPTYTDSDGNIVTLDGTSTFSYVTTIGLYNAENELLAVAKTSRPIEKNNQVDLSIRIRLDY